MRTLLFLFVASIMLVSCGNGKMSEAELQRKIDSIKALEVDQQLRMSGIQLDEVSPFQMFYDSLRLQALPLNYSETYVTYLPDYIEVPTALVHYLDLEGKIAPKAIALPESMGTRLVLLAADLDDGEYELWLYSLDNDYIPVDKLLVYEPSKFHDRKLKENDRDVYFSITSYYDINVKEYTDEYDQIGQLSTYVVDDSRMFVEKKLK